jgi:hypothetical protein
MWHQCDCNFSEFQFSNAEKLVESGSSLIIGICPHTSGEIHFWNLVALKFGGFAKLFFKKQIISVNFLVHENSLRVILLCALIIML